MCQCFFLFRKSTRDLCEWPSATAGSQTLHFRKFIYPSVLGSGTTVCFPEQLCVNVLSFGSTDRAEIHPWYDFPPKSDFLSFLLKDMAAKAQSPAEHPKFPALHPNQSTFAGFWMSPRFSASLWNGLNVLRAQRADPKPAEGSTGFVFDLSLGFSVSPQAAPTSGLAWPAGIPAALSKKSGLC